MIFEALIPLINKSIPRDKRGTSIEFNKQPYFSFKTSNGNIPISLAKPIMTLKYFYLLIFET